MDARSCVIIGAGGFVGGAVVREAERRGFRVTPVTRANYDACKGMSCDLLVNANGNSKKFLARENPPLDFDLSVRSVHAALHDFRATRVVHLSTIDVYSDVREPANNAEDCVIDEGRLSPYGFHKLMAERLVRYFAKSWLVLRMGGFVGPGLRKNSIYDLLHGAPLRVHPDSAYQYLDSRKLAEFVFDLADGVRGNETINCAGEGLISIREIARFIPGVVLSENVTAAPERYEVNIRKLRGLAAVPPSAETVESFVREFLAGRGG